MDDEIYEIEEYDNCCDGDEANGAREGHDQRMQCNESPASKKGDRALDECDADGIGDRTSRVVGVADLKLGSMRVTERLRGNLRDVNSDP